MLEKANVYIKSFADVLGAVPKPFDPDKLKVGVDLGTANICVAALDENDVPLTGEIFAASVVKDGLVVDYIGAVGIVKNLKAQIERRINAELKFGAGAIPPGTVGKNARAVANVIEAAGIESINLVDEPTAAARVLGITDGAVVDVGGGTTGISILKDGKVIDSYDEATGGTHMSLVIAGNYRVSFEEAERMKLDSANHRDLFHVIKPVIEKMASITRRFITPHNVETVYVVGGASSFDGFEEVFANECGVATYKPEHALLVTPLGIAMYCERS